MKRLNLQIGGTLVDDVVCINLKNNKKRRTRTKRQARKKRFPVRFFPAVKNDEHPNIGKFRSHLKCIANARKYRFRSVLILEDDAKVLTPRLAIPNPPENWDMLYLGGNVQSVIQDDDTDQSQVWKRACCLMTHAYVISESAYNVILDQGNATLKTAKEEGTLNELHFDEWLCRDVHSTLRVYITTPERVIQYDGYSDVKQRDITYRQQLTGGIDGEKGCVAPEQLPKPETEMIIDEESGAQYARLKMPPALSENELPNVALITCIHNQADLFQLLQWSYYNIDYPRDKLTWIIADDSCVEDKVSPLIDGSDLSVKYVNCDMAVSNAFLSVAKKQNVAMGYVPQNTRYIMHFSPDCYYPPGSVMARVRLMLAYPQHQCIGCTKYGVYDMSADESWEQHHPDGRGNQTMLFGPSLSYTREFWMRRAFDETQYTLETFYFVRGRWNEVLEVPYGLVLTALSWNGHKVSESARYGIMGRVATSSVTGTAQRNVKRGGDGVLTDAATQATRRTESHVNLSDNFDVTTRNMLQMLGGILGTPDVDSE